MDRQEYWNAEFRGRSNEELLEEYKKTERLGVKQELTMRYVYIVKSIAIQMRDVYLGFTQVEDVVHEGVITLMSAIDRFDISQNVKFETYVAKRIRGMVIDIARKQDWIPRTVRKSAKEINEASMALYSKTGKSPTAKEIAEYLQISIDKLQEIEGKTNLFSVLSLDMILEETSEKKKTVQLPSTVESEQPEQYYLEKEFVGILKDGICSLKENEQKVISLYYLEELNMKKIAEVLQVSEPRISQIHASAILKLKQYIETTVEGDLERKG